MSVVELHPGNGSLLTLAHSLGVKMGSRFLGHAVGWTTNEEAAMRLGRAGARVEKGYNREGPVGWEISFLPTASVR